MANYTTPLDREILTHYYVSPYPFPRCSPHIAGCIAGFIRQGLLKYEEGIIKANHDALKVYMDALAKVPFPTQQWRMP